MVLSGTDEYCAGSRLTAFAAMMGAKVAFRAGDTMKVADIVQAEVVVSLADHGGETFAQPSRGRAAGGQWCHAGRGSEPG